MSLSKFKVTIFYYCEKHSYNSSINDDVFFKKEKPHLMMRFKEEEKGRLKNSD